MAPFDPALTSVRDWLVANGAEIEPAADPREIRFRSGPGLGSVAVDAKGRTDGAGYGRLALAACRMGTTVDQFAVGPVARAPAVVQMLRARAHSVTIITDASFDPATNAAGWAAWMIADGRESMTCGGPLGCGLSSINEAETVALAKALKQAVKAGYVVPGTEVLFQTDSAWALAAVRRAIPSARDRRHATHGIAVQPHRKAQWSDHVRVAVEAVADAATRLSLTIAVRHVPGHTAGDGRQWVNRRCDALAKQHMRDARRALAPSSPIASSRP